MCEKCESFQQRADTLQAILPKEKFDALYERALTESHNVQLPVIVGKFMFPILVWLQSSQEGLSLVDAGELLHELIAIRATFEVHSPLAVTVAKDALTTLCHDMNAVQLDFMEAHAND